MISSRHSFPIEAMVLLLLCSFGALASGQTVRDTKAEALPCFPQDATGNERQRPYTTDQGVITVGCPKIWRSERVFTVLDGLLRDVDSITLKALQDLDPNSANLAQIVSVVNDLQVKAQFNQATGVNNSLKLQQIKINRATELQSVKAAQISNQNLLARQRLLNQESVELQKQELAAVKKGGADPNKNADLKAIQDQKATVQNQLGEIKNELDNPPKVSDASLSSDQGPQLSEPQTGTALANLPAGFNNALQNALQQPAFPPSVQMDNVIELLHQRLAREFSVMYDDLSRQSDQYEIYLLQFDIGILPHHGAKDREAQVTFSFFGRDNDILAYDLYPAMSNYNIMRGMDKTNRIGVSGLAQRIMGFGLAASFNHERHELRSGLSQSLFVSGFGVGTNQFGWLIGPAPFENFLNPGNRIVHAVVLVPKTTHHDEAPTVGLHVSYCWPKRELRHQWWWTGHPQTCSGTQETTIYFTLPQRPQLRINKIAYVPAELKEIDGAPAAQNAENNYLLLSFENPIDSNLVITANSKIINRVRDVRGRGIFGGTPEKLAGNDTEQAAVSGSRFGFLEKDKIDPDSWLQTSSNSLVMNISKDTAGTDIFPVITLAAPGTQPGELTDLLGDNPDVRIGEWPLHSKEEFENAKLPLFTQNYQSGQIRAYIDEVDSNSLPKSIRLVTETPGTGRNRMVWLHEGAQIILEGKDGTPADPKDPAAWALKCDQESGSLSCRVPEAVRNYIKNYGQLKVWIDQPPYFGRPGLWADSDLTESNPVNPQTASATPPVGESASDVPSPAVPVIKPVYAWTPQPYVVGDWSDVREVAGRCLTKWCRWEARIKLKNTNQIREEDPKAANAAGVDPESKASRGGLREAKANSVLCIPELTEASVKSHLENWLKVVAPTLNYSLGQFSVDPLSRTAMVEEGRVIVRELKEQIKDNDFVQVKVKTNGEVTTLSLSMPFSTLPALTELLHVGRCDDNGEPIETKQTVSLPDLYSKVLPGKVLITSLGTGGTAYHIQGDHLRSVGRIRLEGQGKAIVPKISIGFNSVDIFFKTPLKAGTYNVFAIIGGMTVPLQTEDADKKVQSATIVVPDPKDAEKPQPQNTSPKADVRIRLGLNVKGHASADDSDSTEKK